MTDMTHSGAIVDALGDAAGPVVAAFETDHLADTKNEKTIARRTVYVYQAPVRLWHWVNALAMVALFVTGYLIASPPASLSGEASAHFQMGYIRFVHFTAGQIMAIGFLLRIYWAFLPRARSRCCPRSASESTLPPRQSSSSAAWTSGRACVSWSKQLHRSMPGGPTSTPTSSATDPMRRL